MLFRTGGLRYAFGLTADRGNHVNDVRVGNHVMSHDGHALSSQPNQRSNDSTRDVKVGMSEYPNTR